MIITNPAKSALKQKHGFVCISCRLKPTHLGSWHQSSRYLSVLPTLDPSVAAALHADLDETQLESFTKGKYSRPVNHRTKLTGHVGSTKEKVSKRDNKLTSNPGGRKREDVKENEKKKTKFESLEAEEKSQAKVRIAKIKHEKGQASPKENFVVVDAEDLTKPALRHELEEEKLTASSSPTPSPSNRLKGGRKSRHEKVKTITERILKNLELKQGRRPPQLVRRTLSGVIFKKVPMRMTRKWASRIPRKMATIMPRKAVTRIPEKVATMMPREVVTPDRELISSRRATGTTVKRIPYPAKKLVAKDSLIRKVGASAIDGHSLAIENLARAVNQHKELVAAKDIAISVKRPIKSTLFSQAPGHRSLKMSLGKSDRAQTKDKAIKGAIELIEAKKLEILRMSKVRLLESVSLLSVALEVNQRPVPSLSYGLERVLFKYAIAHSFISISTNLSIVRASIICKTQGLESIILILIFRTLCLCLNLTSML